MVKACLAILLLFINASSYSATLKVVLNHQQVEMGKYLNVKIIYQGTQKVDTSNLKSWQSQVFIDRGEVETLTLKNSNIKQIEHLRLYPKQTGKIVLDGIALGGAYTKSITIKVKPTIRKNINLTPQLTISNNKVWQNQLIKVTVKINLLKKSNHIYVAENKFKHFILHHFSKTQYSKNNQHWVLLTWYVSANQIAQQTLNLPKIEQRGKGHWVYYLKTSSIYSKPLPSYLPSTVPVGKIKLSSQLIKQNNQNYWQISLSNQGSLTKEVYGLRKQLANISNTTIDNISVNNIAINQQGIAIQHYLSPIPKWAIAYAPQITIRYFDSQQGQINQQTFRLPRVWAMPTWAKLLMLGLLFIIARLNKQSIKQQVNKWQRQLVFYVKLKQNLTVDQRRQLISHYPYKNKKLQQQLKKLNKVCFSKPLKQG